MNGINNYLLKGSMQINRYLDTGALCFNARYGHFPLLKRSPGNSIDHYNEFDSLFGNEISVFFAHNATSAIRSFAEFAIVKLGYRTMYDEWVHPVILQACNNIIKQKADTDLIFQVQTPMHWLSGEFKKSFDHSDLSKHQGWILIDAVQAVGNLTADETKVLLSLAAKDHIVVGCLHKWIGSSVPLGFALFPTDWLKTHHGLTDFLAARDYLGPSLISRFGFNNFPDTYSSVLADILRQPFFDAVGIASDQQTKQREVIDHNHQLLLSIATQLKSYVVLGRETEKRAIVAIKGKARNILNLSTALNEDYYVHTLYDEYIAGKGNAILRLSAPLVQMDVFSVNRLGEILFANDKAST